MTRTRVLIALTGVALGTVLLTGCVQNDPGPSASHSHSTPKPTATVPATPEPQAPPTSSDAAWIQANKTIQSFTTIQYEIEHDGGANADRISVVAANDALTSTQKIGSDLSSKGLSITGGAPVWIANAAASSFGTVAGADGVKIPNGIVYARGCWDLSKQSTVAKTGAAPPDRSVKLFPIAFNVTYLPDLRIWKVTAQTNITGQSGAPQC